MSPDRRTALVVAGVATAALVALAATSVPWDPVPGGPLDVPSAQDVFTAAQIARAEHFAWWARVWSWSSLALSLLTLGLLGFTGRGRRWVTWRSGPWAVRVVATTAVTLLVVRVVTAPLAVAGREHIREHGLSDQSWSGFARDQLVSWLVSSVTLSVVLLLLLGAARRWERAWPAVAAVGLAGLVLAGSFVYPVVVEPLFNSFSSLPDGPLRREVLALADREGVPVDDVLVADASRRTTTLNAYVSGFGSTRRVVLYDTLVADLPRDEALAVVAHELAHARHRDVVVGSILASLGVMAAVGLLAVVWPGAGDVRRRRLAGGGGVPALLAVAALASFASSPVQNAVSRAIEARADVDALNATRDRAAFVDLQRALALRSLADPTPPAWSQLWFGTHPTVLERVAIADRLSADAPD